jgi:hypothetical protein
LEFFAPARQGFAEPAFISMSGERWEPCQCRWHSPPAPSIAVPIPLRHGDYRFRGNPVVAVAEF